MAKISTNICLDADVKRRAQSMLSDFGLDLSTAVNIFLRQMLREKAIPFIISEEVPNTTTLAAMSSAEKEEDLYGPYDSVADLMVALNA